jgi:hypothetical protein
VRLVATFALPWPVASAAALLVVVTLFAFAHPQLAARCSTTGRAITFADYLWTTVIVAGLATPWCKAFTLARTIGQNDWLAPLLCTTLLTKFVLRAHSVVTVRSAPSSLALTHAERRFEFDTVVQRANR